MHDRTKGFANDPVIPNEAAAPDSRILLRRDKRQQQFCGPVRGVLDPPQAVDAVGVLAMMIAHHTVVMANRGNGTIVS